jgi:hypothetical protein
MRDVIASQASTGLGVAALEWLVTAAIGVAARRTAARTEVVCALSLGIPEGNLTTNHFVAWYAVTCSRDFLV